MKNKIFGIGLNKTGLTSLGNYNLYCSPTYENIVKAKNNINEIYEIADNFEIFEDQPWPLIFKELYYKYPESKFILTIRKNDEEWFDSLVRNSQKKGPTKQSLEVYGYYDPNESNKLDHLIIYKNHNSDVINFFKKNNPNKLLILSTDDFNKEEKIYNFLEKDFDKDNYIKYPHSNKGK